VSGEESHAPSCVKVPNSETVVSARREHQVTLFVMFDVSNGIRVTLENSALFKILALVGDGGVEMDRRNFGVFTTDQEQVAVLVAFN